MAETYALVSTRLDLPDGFWYLHQKEGCTPVIIFYKENLRSSDIRRCYRDAGWKITALTLYTVDSDALK